MFNVLVKGYQAGQDVAHDRSEESEIEAVRAAVLATSAGRIQNGASGRLQITEGPTFDSSILGGRGGYITHVKITHMDVGAKEGIHEVGEGTAEVWASVREEGKRGPAKQYPNRMELRYGEIEKDALAKLTSTRNQDNSTVIRSLLSKAAFFTIDFRFAPATSVADQHRQVETLKSKYSMTSVAGVANPHLPVQPDTLYTVILPDEAQVREAEAEIRGLVGIDLASVLVEAPQ